jgi:hypothetical protein
VIPIIQYIHTFMDSLIPDPQVGDRVTLIDVTEIVKISGSHAQAASPVTPEECSHPRLLPGLDAAYCPDCRSAFGPRSKEYKLLQKTPNPKRVPVKDALELEQTLLDDHSRRPSGVTHTHWVETYSPSNHKGNAYYRYVWMAGQKMHHRHLRGGNVNSGVAQGRALEIKLAIAQGKSPQEIVQMLNGK